MMDWRVLQGDCLAVMRDFAPGSFHCCVTSPPYWGLRDYGTARWEGGEAGCDHSPRAQVATSKTATNSGALRDKPSDVCRCGARRVDAQLGLERVHDCLGWATGRECGECYVCHLVAVFREVKRVLRDDGVLFLNLGDSYAANRMYQVHNTGSEVPDGLKPKDLCGIPWRVALALQADGWWLRSDVIWHKPNPMPESVTDRPTRSHEYVFVLTKSARYFWDSEAVKERLSPLTVADKRNGTGRHTQGKNYSKYYDDESPDKAGADLPSWYRGKTFVNSDSGRNLRSVWTITTKPCKEAHFATFPPDLPEKCIKAATSERGVCPKCGKQWEREVVTVGHEVTPAMRIAGCDAAGEYHGTEQKDYDGTGAQAPSDTKRRILEAMSRVTESHWRPGCECGLEPVPAQVLDPFGGAGTVAVVAVKLGRSSVSVELNPQYCAIARRRIEAAIRQGKLDLRPASCLPIEAESAAGSAESGRGGYNVRAT